MLPMKELAALCTALGLENVRTYIQSGNVVFQSMRPEKSVRGELEQALSKKMGKPVGVVLRTASELSAVLEGNPFPDAPPAKVAVLFLPGAPSEDLLENLVAPGGEQARLGKREIYIYYPDGMGRSKLKLPPSIAKSATARNINTVAKLAGMAKD